MMPMRKDHGRDHHRRPAADDAGPFDARNRLRRHLDRERRSGPAVRVESPRRYSALSTGDPEQAEPPVPIRSARRSVAMPSGRREWAARPDASVVAPRYHGGWSSPES
jgi:hypothetical protein